MVSLEKTTLEEDIQYPLGLLFLWNLLLTGFSIVATIQLMPELLNLLSHPDGFKLSVCYPLNHH
ncbi:unnamed protein product, partial [Allacma fusca]